MLNATKSIFIAVILSFSSLALALDATSTIPDDAKKILNALEKDFKLENISPSSKKAIYDQFSFALEDGWYSWWIGNDDLDASKFKEHKVRVFDLIVTNKNRISNITFTYFPDANQIFYIRKQYVEGSSEAVLNIYNEYKEEDDTEIKHETNSYAFTKKKGYVDFDIFHVKGSEAMVGYIDAGVIDLK